VVFHSAVLAYLPTEAQESFAETVRALPGHWIANEGPRVLPSVGRRLPRSASEDRAAFVLALDGQPVAFTGPHGQSLDWFAWLRSWWITAVWTWRSSCPGTAGMSARQAVAVLIHFSR
jgi:hypothetical protein